MKKSAIFIVVLFLTVQCNTSKTVNSNIKNPTNNTEKNYSKNSLIISYDPVIGKKYLLEKINEYDAVINYDYKIIDAIAITIPENKSLEDAEKFFKNVKGVIQVNKNYINRIN